MFVLEPFIAKMLLPLLGGSPNVWNTCVVFFQITLLCGYLYAHILTKNSKQNLPQLSTGRQISIQLLVVWLPLLLLPLRAPQDPPTEGHPYLWLFFTLVCLVGGVFFAISTTAPLLQKWFATVGDSEGKDPYFLYAASNLGAMVGLIAYPFFLEPGFSLLEQSTIAAVLYVIFAGLITACAVLTYRHKAPPAAAEAVEQIQADEPKEVEATSNTLEPGKLERSQIVRLLCLTFIPASLTLGLTTYVTSELSAIPLFWVAPLFIYLTSFVIAFSRPPKKVISVFRWIAPPAILAALAPIAWQMSAPTDINHAQLVTAGTSVHMLALFLVCCACHGTVAEQRPNPEHLTKYFLIISLGGVLGSSLNALVAPAIFDSWIEYPLVMIAAIAILIPPRIASVWLAIAIVGLWLSLNHDESVVYRARNFFGCISVRVDRLENVSQFFHGVTEHGSESLDPEIRLKPISYFHPQGIIGGLLMQTFGLKEGSADGGRLLPAREMERAPYAVLGLGCGALSAYASKNQTMMYYEINPDVIEVAKDPFFFSYIFDAKQRQADVRIIAGDGRLAIQKAPYNYFKLIVMDAFSSDSIPTHLVTKEAVQMYLSKLRKDGLLIFHITNNYYDLKPVLWTLAQELGLHAVTKNDYTAAQMKNRYPTEWVVLSQDKELLQPLSEIGWKELLPGKKVRLWTDNYCSPQSVLIVPMS